MKSNAPLNLAINIAAEPLENLIARWAWAFPIESSIHICKQVRVLIRFTTDHRPIDVAQVILNLLQREDATVDDDLQVLELLFQLVDPVVAERRNLSILFGTQSL